MFDRYAKLCMERPILFAILVPALAGVMVGALCGVLAQIFFG